MRRHFIAILAFLLIGLSTYSQLVSSTTVIHAGLLIDGTGSEPSEEMSIIVQDGLIRSYYTRSRG